ncbi:MAG: hypothetical protein PHW53_00070 [Patescibacteria group bacterium]|nr:hypothetical protein [Patescibacteria group bacterium]
MMDVSKQSKKWKREAVNLLQDSGVENILKEFGDVIFTGAYAADLMMSGDIDIYVVNKSYSKKKVLEIFNKLTNFCSFEGYLFFDWKKNKHPDFPSAYYVGLKKKINKTKWKIDIWLLTPEDLHKLPYFSLKPDEISKEQKLAILKFKNYRNKFFQNISSKIIYDIVLKHNITTVKVFKKYIKNKF